MRDVLQPDTSDEHGRQRDIAQEIEFESVGRSFETDGDESQSPGNGRDGENVGDAVSQ